MGFDEVTVTAVAQRLNATHAALYRHVTDRDDLVRSAVERVAARAPEPPLSDDWAECLRGEAWIRWRIFTEYPGIRQAVASMEWATEPFAARSLPLMQQLVALGFSAQQALLAVDLVIDQVDQSAMTAVSVRRMGAEKVRALVDSYFPEDQDEVLREIAYHAMAEDQDEWFASKLAVTLAGIRVTLAPGIPATPPGDA